MRGPSIAIGKSTLRPGRVRRGCSQHIHKKSIHPPVAMSKKDRRAWLDVSTRNWCGLGFSGVGVSAGCVAVGDAGRSGAAALGRLARWVVGLFRSAQIRLGGDRLVGCWLDW